jgi:hypothetical protein
MISVGFKYLLVLILFDLMIFLLFFMRIGQV